MENTYQLAKNPNTPKETLIKLSKYGNNNVKRNSNINEINFNFYIIFNTM